MSAHNGMVLDEFTQLGIVVIREIGPIPELLYGVVVRDENGDRMVGGDFLQHWEAWSSDQVVPTLEEGAVS